MKRWKGVALAALGFMGLGVLGVYVYMQGLGDLRTDYAKAQGASAGAQQKGRELMAHTLAKLGGVERWEELREQAVTVTLTHDWHHELLRRFFMPLEFSGQKLTLLSRPGHLDTRLEFLDGERQGTAWGLRNGESYKVDSAGAITWEADETIEFHVPSYRFLFFLTFLLSEAEWITYAGSQEMHGKTYELVYATWGQWEPHHEADQYMLWIERESLQVDYVQSTVREKFSRSIVSLALADYREVMGLEFPFSLKVLEDIEVNDVGMHHMKILDIQSTPEDAAKLLVDDEDR